MLEAQGDQGNYTGTITLAENAFKFTAAEKGDELAGSFATPDGQFDFKAAIKGEDLTLTTGETHYKLTRLNGNPLAKAKAGDATGGKIKNFVRQQGGGFLSHFVSAVAGNKGQVSQSASAAAFDTLATMGQAQVAQPDPGALAPPVGGQSVAGVPGFNGGNGVAVSGADPRVSGLLGTWVKTEQTLVNGASSTKVLYAVLRDDGAMLITVAPQSARNFSNKLGNGLPPTTGAGQNADADVRGRWSSNGATLTIAYEGGVTAQYACEVRPNVSGWLILRIQGADGSPVQEWSKANSD